MVKLYHVLGSLDAIGLSYAIHRGFIKICYKLFLNNEITTIKKSFVDNRIVTASEMLATSKVNHV